MFACLSFIICCLLLVNKVAYKTINFGVQEVKVQRHRRPKLNLEAWRGIILDPIFGEVGFLISEYTRRHRVVVEDRNVAPA